MHSLEKQISFLQTHGAEDLEHTDSDLLEHLEGTRSILQGWGESTDVVTAGLFHSVYGTEVYQDQMIPPTLRPQVQALIGPRAERIAYLFGALERKSFLESVMAGRFTIHSRFDGTLLSDSEEEFRAVCAVYVANRLEQRPRWDEDWKYQEMEEMREIRRFISAAAGLDLAKEYRM